MSNFRKHLFTLPYHTFSAASSPSTMVGRVRWICLLLGCFSPFMSVECLVWRLFSQTSCRCESCPTTIYWLFLLIAYFQVLREDLFIETNVLTSSFIYFSRRDFLFKLLRISFFPCEFVLNDEFLRKSRCQNFREDLFL